MEIKKNVTLLDAFFRIMIGLTGVAWGTSRLVRRPYRTGPLLVTLLSAMKVAEGITRFCPTLSLLGINPLERIKQKELARVGQQAQLPHDEQQKRQPEPEYQSYQPRH